MNRKSILVIAALLMVTMFTANAQNNTLKIGYCSPEYVLNYLPDAQTIQKELEVYEKQLQAQLESKYAEYQRKAQEYQQGVASGTMPTAVREDKEKELVLMEKSIKEYEERAQVDMQNKQYKLLQPVLEKIQKAIDKVAEANGYTYIFNTHTEMDGSAIILYAKNKGDNISDLVLKELGVTPPPPTTPGTTPAPGGSTTPAPGNSGNSGAPVKPMAPTK